MLFVNNLIKIALITYQDLILALNIAFVTCMANA